MGALGIAVPIERLIQPRYVSSKRGSTIVDLTNAAKDLGVPAQPLGRMTCRMLRQLDAPAILHFKRSLGGTSYDHWVLYMGLNEKGDARIYEGLRPESLMHFGEIAARWDGIAIVLSSDPTLYCWTCLEALVPLAAFAALSGLFVSASRLVRALLPYASSGMVSLAVHSGGECILLLAWGATAWVGAAQLNRDGVLSYSPAIEAIQEARRETFFPLVSAREVARLITEPRVAIIDARLEDDYERGRIGEAINVPPNVEMEECRRRLEPIPHSARIVVYSQSRGCPYIGYAVQKLRALGYRNLLLFRGGWEEWTSDPRIERANEHRRKSQFSRAAHVAGE